MLAELQGDPLVGTTLDSRYVIEECIGEGGMGRVYRAKNTRMSRNYAIKILFGDYAGDARMRSRFAREAEAVSRLDHANVISVVDFGENAGGLLYLVMDLAKGESLAELMLHEAPMAPDRAVAILAKLAKGLAHAHAQGLVHRDFKGENVIMVCEEEQEVPRIVDFGICTITEDSPSSTMLTSNGMVMGTPAVMAPEQASGDTVDHRTDLFSLGLVDYQMLSGKLPFEGTPLDMARKNLYEPIPTIMERSSVAVPAMQEGIIHKLTAKQPKERYQSAKEALLDMRALGIGGNTSDWSAPTPMPAPLRSDLPDAGQFSSPSPSTHGGNFSRQATNGGHFPTPSTNAGPHSVGFTNQRSTPMTTKMPGSSEFQTIGRKTSRRTLLIVGMLATAVVAASISLSGGEGNNATEPLAATTANDAQLNSGATVEPKNVEPKNVEPAGTATVAPDAGVGKKLVADARPKKTIRKNSGNRKNPDIRKDRHQKDPVTKPTEKPPLTLPDVKKLYTSVSKALGRLEQAKGKSAVANLRSDYLDIAISKVYRDATLLPVYQQSLLRLRKYTQLTRSRSCALSA
ncbi:MAG: serine/threonine protein kinase [Myxococcales bacterium]|nr:serine/threonine protein kinase [Myxococcales bacterium]